MIGHIIEESNIGASWETATGADVYDQQSRVNVSSSSASSKFGLVWFILCPCQHDDGYIDGRSQIKVHTDERTQVHSAWSSLTVTHPSTNQGWCCLTSVNVPLTNLGCHHKRHQGKHLEIEHCPLNISCCNSSFPISSPRCRRILKKWTWVKSNDYIY